MREDTDIFNSPRSRNEDSEPWSFHVNLHRDPNRVGTQNLDLVRDDELNRDLTLLSGQPYRYEETDKRMRAAGVDLAKYRAGGPARPFPHPLNVERAASASCLPHDER